MTHTIETEIHIIIYQLERIISFAHNHQYLCVANCVVWISAIIRLEEGLPIHIDNPVERYEIFQLLPLTLVDQRNQNTPHQQWKISTTPRDIEGQWLRSTNTDSSDEGDLGYIWDSLRCTWTDRVNCVLRKNTKQLKRAWKHHAPPAHQAEAQRSNIRKINEIWEQILSNLLR